MSQTSQITDTNPSSNVCVATPASQTTTPGPLRRRWQATCAALVETAKVAIVDDEEMNIEVVQGYLQHEGYRNFCRTTDATKALEMIGSVQPDVVLLDVMMPDVSGLEILSAMRLDERMYHIPVIVLTACTGPETKLQALQLGPSDFLAKPVDASELLLRVRNVLAVKSYQDHLANHSAELERMVDKRTQELVASRQRIIHCLARAAEFRDDDTGHHVTRVGKYAAVIADELGFDNRAIELIEQAAKLHDIGKIGVPDSVLLKEGKLEANEFELIKRHCGFGNSIIDPKATTDVEAYQKHTRIGATLLEGGDGYPVMEIAAVIAQTHHEKWDGSGYPLGLHGENIPIEGRITAVADVFDALSSKRPYKPVFPREKCFEILKDSRGTHFDPKVLDAFFARSDEIVRIQIRFAEH